MLSVKQMNYLIFLNNLLHIFKKRFYVFIFIQRGKEEKRHGEKHQCVGASRTPPTGDLACNPGMCSDWKANK